MTGNAIEASSGNIGIYRGIPIAYVKALRSCFEAAKGRIKAAT
jgi:hypothetical protein